MKPFKIFVEQEDIVRYEQYPIVEGRRIFKTCDRHSIKTATMRIIMLSDMNRDHEDICCQILTATMRIYVVRYEPRP